MSKTPPLGHLLDGSGGSPSDAALSAVVSRHRRRRAARLRSAGLGAVVVLGGSALGVGLSHAFSSSSSARLAGKVAGAPAGPVKLRQPSASTGTGGSEAGSSGPALPPAPSGLHFVRGVATTARNAPSFAFATGAVPGADQSGICTRAGCGGVASNGVVEVATRKVGSLRVTAYLVTLSKLSRGGVERPLGSSAGGTSGAGGTSLPSLPASVPSCERARELLVEVSSPKSLAAVAVVPVATGVQGAFENLAEALVTPPGSKPVVVAVAEVSEHVAAVSARFVAGGTDETAPAHGWVLLVGRPSASEVGEGVSLVATSTTGAVLERAQLPAPGYAAVRTGSC